uniref:WASH1 WAHD domain-containing protein n=1 Tax=Romanomermis culicivorax TaxID=13658 RepID=A0A915K9H8_ROMCU
MAGAEIAGAETSCAELVGAQTTAPERAFPKHCNYRAEELPEEKTLKYHNKLDFKRIHQQKNVHYNVRLKVDASNRRHEYQSGYGTMPNNVTSVADALIFNTGLNPYIQSSKYEDPFSTKSRTRQGANLDHLSISEIIGSAPITITNSELEERHNANFSYKPTFDTIPDFDVPELLPDLPGIADLSFSALARPLTAAIPTLSNLIPELPDIVNRSTFTQSSAPALTSTTSSPPPPPPPPPPLMFTSSTSVPVKQSLSAPPPPAPPPPPQPLVDAVSKADASTESPITTTKPSDRSDLLKSIIDAGGAANFKFRSAQGRYRDRKMKRDKEDEELRDMENTDASKSGLRHSPSGDIMADLTRALTLRRKGIAGNNSNLKDKTRNSQKSPTTSSSNNLLAGLSAVIPPQVMEKEMNLHPAVSNEEWED